MYDARTGKTLEANIRLAGGGLKLETCERGGVFCGGHLADKFGRRDARYYSLAPVFGLLVAFPILVRIYTAPSWQMAAAFMVLPGLFTGLMSGPSFTVVQNAAPTHQRATGGANVDRLEACIQYQHRSLQSIAVHVRMLLPR